MPPGYGRKGGGGRAFGAPPKQKETIAERVAKHRKPRAARAEDGFLPEPEEPKPGAHVSDKTVGNLFTFPPLERAVIQVIIKEYEKKLKEATKSARECAASEGELATIRSRCALVLDAIEKAGGDEEITLAHPLRVTLGAGCSLHMRWLKKEKNRLGDRMIENADIEDACELTQRIANKIGEQLVLFLQPEDDE